MTILLYISLLCLTSYVGGQGQSTFLPCAEWTTDNTGPSLPTLPDQFVMHVEANIVQKGYTTNFKEYYDYPNNRGVIEIYNKTSGQKIRSVMDFGNQKTWLIYDNKTCHYKPANVSSGMFRFMTNSDGSHIRGVKDLLAFGPDDKEKYMGGAETVRGIPADHWRTCQTIQSHNATVATFMMDYYFSKSDNYKIDGASVRIPLRAVINGSGSTWGRNHTTRGGSHDFYHIYEFTDFHSGPINDSSIFEIPIGVYCDNPADAKPMPKLPRQFSVGLEQMTYLGPDYKVAHVSQHVYYDYVSKIIRVDNIGRLLDHERQKYGNSPITMIHDFNTSLLYVIDQWEDNCTVSMVTRHDYRDNPWMDMIYNIVMQNPTILTPAHLFNLLEGDYVYQGNKTYRGLQTESWALYNTTTGRVTEVFFEKEPLDDEDTTPQTAKYTLVGIYNSGTNIISSMGSYLHFYGLTSGHPDPDVFDVWQCYSLQSHYAYMAFLTDGNYVKDVLHYKREFMSAVRSAIARAARVSVTRVNSILIEQDPYSETTLRVYFKLLDNTLTGITSAIAGPSLEKAKTYLKSAVGAGLNFDVQYPTIEENFAIQADTLWETMYSKGISPDDGIKQYGPGAMAGLGIGMLVIGAILGLVGAYIIYKRVDTSIPYAVTN